MKPTKNFCVNRPREHLDLENFFLGSFVINTLLVGPSKNTGSCSPSALNMYFET